MSSAVRAIPKPQHSSLEWQRLRHRDEDGRAVFGASEAPVLMGSSPYEQPTDLLVRKMNEAAVSDETSPAMQTGNLLEPVLIERAASVLQVPLVTPDFMFGRGRFIATPDGIDAGTSSLLEEYVGGAMPEVWVEAKCTSRYRVKSLDDVPDMWRWQMAAQAYTIGGAANMFLVVLDADLHINIIEVPRNPEAEAALEQTAEELGRSIDEGNVPDEIVPMLTANDVARLWRPVEESVELGDGAADWLFALEDAKHLRKQADEQEERAKAWIAQQLRGATAGTINGEVVVTWKEQAGRSSIDTKRLTEELPEIAAQYTRKGEPFRVMRTSRAKKGAAK